MQLRLDEDDRTDILRRAQSVLISQFGRIERRADQRRDPVWTLVQGVIGARTKTAISNAATDRLLSEFGTWEEVAEAPVEQVLPALASQTYRQQSAKRLKACLTALIGERGAADLRHLSNLPTDEAMIWLETLPGVGRKISAGVMNTSNFERTVLVVDSHHLRIARRMGLVPPRADTTRAYAALMPLIPPEWSAADLDEHHMLIKRLGQSLCRPSSMDCQACPLAEDCATGRERLRAGVAQDAAR